MRRTIIVHDSEMASTLGLASEQTTLTASTMQSLTNSACANGLFSLAILHANRKLAMVAFFCKDENFLSTVCCRLKLFT